MTCEKNGNDLIAQLPIGHLGAIVVLSRQQHGKQVALVGRVGATLRDETKDNFVEAAGRGCGAKVSRNRQPRRRQHQFSKVGVQLHDRFQRGTHLSSIAIDIRIEQRLCDDLQGEAHHLRVHVTLFAALPFGDHPFRVVHHSVRIRSDAASMKSGLSEAPLAQPKVAFAGQQSIPEQALIRAQNPSLYKFSILGDQHFLDEVGMVHQIKAEIVVAHRDDVAVLA